MDGGTDGNFIIIGSTALSGPWPPQNAEIQFIIVQLQIFQVFLMMYKRTLHNPKELAVIQCLQSLFEKFPIIIKRFLLFMLMQYIMALNTNK